METTKKSYVFVAPLLVAASALIVGFCYEISRSQSGPSQDSPVNSSQKSVAASAHVSGPLIEYLGGDRSMDMGSYVIENYHVPLNNDESDKDLSFEKETSELCRAAFSKREAEFLEHGVDNYVQCMTDGKFIFAANMGKKGNFGFSFDVGNDPAAIAEEFSVGLDKLINQLNALDDEPEDAGPGDLGNMQETSRKRKKEPFFPTLSSYCRFSLRSFR